MFSPMYREAQDEGGPFRSLFPCRYYLIDFEVSIRFEPGTVSAGRRVSPKDRLLETHGMESFANYGKVSLVVVVLCLI